MIQYLINVILCSAVFLLAYKLLLEKERVLIFNRFYLIGSLIFSFLIPKITFETTVESQPISVLALPQNTFTPSNEFAQVISTSENPLEQNNILLWIYGIVAILLFIRFLHNLVKILLQAISNINLPNQNAKLVLLKEKVMPHSFLNYIFLNEEEYTKNTLEPEILTHELSHIHQKHTYDIIFIEILQILFWFNPIIFLYRKAVQLNHEFLADQAVLNTCQNMIAYQNLLISKASSKHGFNLSSQFNYSITKQRLIMISKSNSPQNAIWRQLAIVPVCALLVYVFSTKTTAQSTKPTEKGKITEPVSISSNGVSPVVLAEFEKTVSNVISKDGKARSSDFSIEETNKLGDIFMQMNKAQQEKQMIRIAKKVPLPRQSPTKEEMKLWLNDKKYGLWIDDKRVPNTALTKYNNTDIAQVFVSKLGINTINYGKHYYQVDLMTKAHYEAYLKKEADSGEKYIVWYKLKRGGIWIEKGK